MLDMNCRMIESLMCGLNFFPLSSLSRRVLSALDPSYKILRDREYVANSPLEFRKNVENSSPSRGLISLLLDKINTTID